ncbi:Spermidine N(1)-acetyltransferase [Thalassocella blandensis]|nr:Spermidine N(1)-acetyltransferase [Thalassocella blandensis]
MERIVEIYDHPKVVPESSQHPFLGFEKISEIFENCKSNSIVLVAEAKNVIGGYLKIDLNNKPRSKHVASLGMAVHPDLQGQGIGGALIRSAIDQAENWLNIIRMELEVYSDNKKAIGLYKKVGFEIEGEMKYASFKNGEYVNIVRMARISKGFNKLLHPNANVSTE